MAQLYIHGDPLKSHLVAVVVAEVASVLNVARQFDSYKSLSETDIGRLKEAASDHRVIQYVLNSLDIEAERAGLKR